MCSSDLFRRLDLHRILFGEVAQLLEVRVAELGIVVEADLGIEDHVDNLQVQSLEFTIAGAGDAKLGQGSAQSAEYSIAGAGDIDAKGITSTTAKVSIAGSGSVSANASGAADVSIMGAGNVDIAGGAKCSVHKMGAGDVRCS